MTVLHCIGYYTEGYFYRQNYYTDFLSQNDNKVYVLTSFTALKYYPVEHLKHKSHNVKVKRINNKKVIVRIKPCFQVKDIIYFKFKKIIKQIKPDVVHIYEARQYIPYRIAKYCVKNNIPFVYEHEQRIEGRGLLGKIKSSFFVNRWLKFIVTNAQLVRVVTPGAKQYVIKHCGEKHSDKIYVSTLAYDKNRNFFDMQQRIDFRKKYNIDNNKIVLAVSGKYSDRKKIEVIIRAFKKVHRIDLVFIIIGVADKNYSPIISETIGTAENIIWKNKLLPQNELNEFFNGIDYIIWTAPTISFFEALATGLKIIIPYGEATSHLNSKNIIYYGKNGGIEVKDNCIQDDDVIEKELVNIITGLNKYKREINNDVEQYEATAIVKELNFQYEKILHLK